MKEQQYESRIAQLEHCIEDLLEGFDEYGDDYWVEVEVDESDGSVFAPAKVCPEMAELLDIAHDTLYEDSLDEE